MKIFKILSSVFLLVILTSLVSCSPTSVSEDDSLYNTQALDKDEIKDDDI